MYYVQKLIAKMVLSKNLDVAVSFHRAYHSTFSIILPNAGRLMFSFALGGKES